jgi:thioredoxin reductase (NADPH)
VIKQNNIAIKENSKVENVTPENKIFKIETLTGEICSAKKVLLTIGRRGSPRKLNIPGEDRENVAYRLLEPEIISDKQILVVGGGDSAIENALMLADQNKVTLSYRSDAFSRIKPGNQSRISKAIAEELIDVKFNTNPTSIEEGEVVLLDINENKETRIKNDLVYIFAGGELPSQFLQKTGIQITKKFGEAILKH